MDLSWVNAHLGPFVDWTGPESFREDLELNLRQGQKDPTPDFANPVGTGTIWDSGGKGREKSSRKTMARKLWCLQFSRGIISEQVWPYKRKTENCKHWRKYQ